MVMKQIEELMMMKLREDCRGVIIMVIEVFMRKLLKIGYAEG